MKEILLVDGYNVIYQFEELKNLASTDLAHARERLLELLSRYHGLTGIPVLVVFDGRGDEALQEEHLPGVNVCFTRAGETADAYIERYVVLHGKGRKITVITSDLAEQKATFWRGALRMPVRELEQQLREMYRQEKSFSPPLEGSLPLESCLDPVTRRKLAEMRREEEGENSSSCDKKRR
ncbi:MAG: uncharacterized protein PWQ31_770 [Eubacteriales bacterium]|nr:uncharacterized protein [Eubacteriales bacterium]